MTTPDEKIPIGISECLLGEPVRFDGGHKRNRFLTDVMSRYFDYRPVCPEVLIGLGIPRKPIRLVATDKGTRVRGVDDDSLDVTEALAGEADSALDRMPDLCGYVLMQNSPSCGAFRMKRYGENGFPLDSDGVGAFAERLMELHPLLPVEEAGRLTDAGLRDNFIARVFAYKDWKDSVGSYPGQTRGLLLPVQIPGYGPSRARLQGARPPGGSGGHAGYSRAVSGVSGNVYGRPAP